MPQNLVKLARYRIDFSMLRMPKMQVEKHSTQLVRQLLESAEDVEAVSPAVDEIAGWLIKSGASGRPD